MCIKKTLYIDTCSYEVFKLYKIDIEYCCDKKTVHTTVHLSPDKLSTIKL